MELFELFFDNDVKSMLVENSVLYARWTGNHTFQVDKQTMEVFFALLLMSGYNVLSRRRMYWEQQPDVHCEAASAEMSRNRFEEILKYFHTADNSKLPKNDKFAKVDALLSMLNENWLQFKPQDRNLSIDESMISYYG